MDIPRFGNCIWIDFFSFYHPRRQGKTENILERLAGAES
jgi:hypothetical protein